MDRIEFWRLVEAAKEESNGDSEEQVKILVKKLEKLPAEDILTFERIFWELMLESYNNDLWAAAYIINGGCSNDCFDYFRGWLIAQGRTVYENALKDPEILVDIAEFEEVELENMLGVGMTAYEAVTGQEMPENYVRSFLGLTPTGEEWDEDSLETKYPKLTSKFY